MIPTAKEDRAKGFAAGRANQVNHVGVAQSPIVPAPEFRDMPHDVLDHHDRAVDDQSEVDRTEAHQVP